MRMWVGKYLDDWSDIEPWLPNGMRVEYLLYRGQSNPQFCDRRHDGLINARSGCRRRGLAERDHYRENIHIIKPWEDSWRMQRSTRYIFYGKQIDITKSLIELITSLFLARSLKLILIIIRKDNLEPVQLSHCRALSWIGIARESLTRRIERWPR